MSNDKITLQEAARISGLSYNHIRERVQLAEIPHSLSRSGTILLNPDAIEKLLLGSRSTAVVLVPDASSERSVNRYMKRNKFDEYSVVKIKPSDSHLPESLIQMLMDDIGTVAKLFVFHPETLDRPLIHQLCDLCIRNQIDLSLNNRTTLPLVSE